MFDHTDEIAQIAEANRHGFNVFVQALSARPVVSN